MTYCMSIFNSIITYFVFGFKLLKDFHSSKPDKSTKHIDESPGNLYFLKENTKNKYTSLNET